MRLPHTVTLFQPDGDGGRTRTVLSGVLLEAERGTTLSKAGMNSADAVTLHIPLAAAPEGLVIRPESDFFCRGDVSDEGQSYQELRAQYETYRVTAAERFDY